MLECVLAIEKWILITAVKWKEEIRENESEKTISAAIMVLKKSKSEWKGYQWRKKQVRNFK